MPSGCPSVRLFVIKSVSTISYKPLVGISPNFYAECSWGRRLTDYILRSMGTGEHPKTDQPSSQRPQSGAVKNLKEDGVPSVNYYVVGTRPKLDGVPMKFRACRSVCIPTRLDIDRPCTRVLVMLEYNVLS